MAKSKIVLPIGAANSPTYHTELREWGAHIDTIPELQGKLVVTGNDLAQVCNEMDARSIEIEHTRQKLLDLENAQKQSAADREAKRRQVQSSVEAFVNGSDEKAAACRVVFAQTGKVKTNLPMKGAIKRSEATETSGELRIMLAATIKDATRGMHLSYTYNYNDPNPTWHISETLFTSSNRLILTGLTKAKEIAVRVRGVNSVGNGPWSDPEFAVVQ
jgi:hypothetical protein